MKTPFFSHKSILCIQWVLFLLLVQPAQSQVVHYTDASYRALSPVNDSLVLLAGSKGRVVLKSTVTDFWFDISPKPLVPVDYRSSSVLNDSTFLVATAGSPGFILKTTNRGYSWDTTWFNMNEQVFIDGMAFYDDKVGYAFGDPLDGYLLVLKTNDGGNTWQRIPKKQLGKPKHKTEASFAASNSGIQITEDGVVLLSYSSEKRNRVLYFYEGVKKWKGMKNKLITGSMKTKLISGKAKGIYGSALARNELVLVGGSYLDSTAAIQTSGVLNIETGRFQPSTNPVLGYRSGVACIKSVCIATGRTGTDISFDAGLNWESFNHEAYYTVVAHEKKFYFTGKKGRFKVVPLAEIQFE